MLDKLCPIRSVDANVASSERGFALNLVGHLFKDDSSNAIFKLVYCVDGDCTAGCLVEVAVESSSNRLCVDKCSVSGIPCGVAKCTFASASFGLVQVAGIATAVAGITLPSAGSLCVAAATAGACMLADLTTASHAARLAGVCVEAATVSAGAILLALRSSVI